MNVYWLRLHKDLTRRLTLTKAVVGFYQKGNFSLVSRVFTAQENRETKDRTKKKMRTKAKLQKRPWSINK